MRSIVLVGALLVMMATAYGQAPTVPTIDADDRLIVEGLSVLVQSANTDCQQLGSYKKATDYRKKVAERIEAKYPGFTLGADGKLAAKPAQQVKK